MNELALTGLGPRALAELMPKNDRPSLTRGRAVWAWLREVGLPEAWPERLPEVGKDALAALREQVRLPEARVEAEVASRDGTTKWRLSCRGAPIETVLIPNTTRATVCVSSQSGCTRYCDFCATARMPFGGQLTSGDIVAQVLLAHAHAKVHAKVPLTNVVLMGMGEPLDNLEAVLGAIEVLDEGLGIAPRHVTVSTSGVLPKMQALWSASRASLALSLHATTQEVRDRLMPRVRRWPIEALVEWMREASAVVEPGKKPRHFFIEYALLEGVNDSDEDADRLVALLRGVRARVNLIPFNPTPTLPYRRPSPERVRAFQARIMSAGLLCIVRETRGDDAMAACGQLAAA